MADKKFCSFRGASYRSAYGVHSRTKPGCVIVDVVTTSRLKCPYNHRDLPSQHIKD